MPIFLLRTQSALLVSKEQLGRATPAAADAVRSQQSQIAILVAAWPWLSAALVVTGFAIVFVGARAWRHQQKRLESREEAELSKIRAEGEKAQQETLALVKAQRVGPDDTPEQVDADPGHQTVEPSDSATPELARRHDQETAETRPRPHAASSRELLRDRVLSRIAGHFGATMELVSEVKLGPASVADGVFVSRVAELPNLLVEVRTIERVTESSVRTFVQEVAGWSLAATSKAEHKFGPGFVPLVIAVVDTGSSDNGKRLRQARFTAAEEAVSFNSYPKTLALLFTESARLAMPRLDAVPAMSAGIHVV